MRKSILVLALYLLPSYGYSQLWDGILNSTRAIDWTAVGVPGGIPTTRTQCGSTIQASTYGNGSSDATSGIQTALNGCASNTYLLLSAGTFRINTSLSVPSNVTLRGAGADQTILTVYGSSNGAINLGTGGISSSNTVNITSGATAGSTSIVVSSASNISIGKYLHITELNNSSLHVTNVGENGTCTWCDDYWNGARVRGQTVEVTSVNGTTIGISPGLYSDYTLTPQATPYTAVKYAGVESLQVYGTGTGYGSNFYFSACAYCWLKGVESNYTGTTSTTGEHVELDYAYRCEVRDSYFSNGYSQGTGSHNVAIMIARKTSASLIENNILDRGQGGITVAWGPAGNVIAYNYLTGGFRDSSTVLGGIDIHAPHPQFNLYEGNILPYFWADGVWGSSGVSTVFRNWTKGTTRICSPVTAGRQTVTSSCSYGPNAARAMIIDFASAYHNLVGNVIGSAEQSGLTETKTAQVIAPTSRPWSAASGVNYGYDNQGDTGTDPLDSTVPYDTAFVHGDYNNIDSSLTWAGGITHTLPASFYRSSKPSWWVSTIPWPAIGPDVTGGAGPGGHTYSLTASNPAQNCYIAISGGVDGGTGSPLTFNADACYPTLYETTLSGGVVILGTTVVY